MGAHVSVRLPLIFVLLALLAPPVLAADENSSSSSPKLYGRIEELYNSSGARLPVNVDSSRPVEEEAQAERLSGDSYNPGFPVDFLGTWSGDLRIISSSFDQLFWDFDENEAETQRELLKPGLSGQCRVIFFRAPDRTIAARPCNVIFSRQNGKKGQSFFLLHLGDLNSGWGVTGNELSSRLIKNSLKSGSKNDVEQEIVTLDRDRNPITRKIQAGYTENVLHFIKIDQTHLQLQAASVSYNDSGRFLNKVILRGTLSKSNGDLMQH